jgi:hypothetical protein
MLSPNRDVIAARLFLRLALSGGRPRPRVINVGGHPAYASAVAELKQTGELGPRCRCRTAPYLNNIIEQDHGFIKKRITASLGFRSAEGACRTIEGYEAMHAIRKGQVRWVPNGDAIAQRDFIHGISASPPRSQQGTRTCSTLGIRICNTTVTGALPARNRTNDFISAAKGQQDRPAAKSKEQVIDSCVVGSEQVAGLVAVRFVRDKRVHFRPVDGEHRNGTARTGANRLSTIPVREIQSESLEGTTPPLEVLKRNVASRCRNRQLVNGRPLELTYLGLVPIARHVLLGGPRCDRGRLLFASGLLSSVSCGLWRRIVEA